MLIKIYTICFDVINEHANDIGTMKLLSEIIIGRRFYSETETNETEKTSITENGNYTINNNFSFLYAKTP